MSATPELIAARKVKKAAYQAAWREANKVEISAVKAAYREANKGQIAAYQAAWREANKGQIAIYSAAWHSANKGQIAIYGAAYREANKGQIAAWHAANKDKRAAYYAANKVEISAYHAAYRAANKVKKAAIQAAYYAANPELFRRAGSRRRAFRLNNGYDIYTEKQVLEIYGTDCHLCNLPIDFNAPRSIGKTGWGRALHIDHLVPISKGGADTLENVRPSHGLCNLSKGDRRWEPK